MSTSVTPLPAWNIARQFNQTVTIATPISKNNPRVVHPER